MYIGEDKKNATRDEKPPANTHTACILCYLQGDDLNVHFMNNLLSDNTPNMRICKRNGQKLQNYLTTHNIHIRRSRRTDAHIKIHRWPHLTWQK